ncbi:MAG: ABC transporter substrate-binding protein [Bdellovibrionales bacterium]|jgi:phospholipid transport system substrate-binding protein
MKRVAILFALPLFLITFLMASSAQAETPAAAIVQKFYDTLQATMQEGQELGFEGRYKKLEPAVTSAFNLPLMARYAVASNWAKANDEDKQKLVSAFSAFSVATYASRFTKFDGEVFKVGDEKPAAGGGIMVETTLTPKGSDPVILNYLLRPDETGALRIVDVYLDASISELATRRAEFTSVIKREGMPTLLRSLDEKTKKMGQSKQG